MVGSQKILTVSYGTFSCTLEGFEDSFGTMKAIAEYFRDLAAEDRYFGAEPPVPDAEMLARIAEREVARRVGARLERTGLVLRVDEGAAGRTDAAPAAPSGAATAAPGGPAMPPPPLDDAPRDEGVVAKLARIRAVAGRSDLVSAEEEPGDAAPRPGLEGEEAAGWSAGWPASGAASETAEDEGADDAAPLAPVAHFRPRVVPMRQAASEAESEGASDADDPVAGVEAGEPEAGPAAGAEAAGAGDLLPPEVEAELMAELAALEAAMGAPAPAADEPAKPDDAAQAAVAGLMAALDGARSPLPDPAPVDAPEMPAEEPVEPWTDVAAETALTGAGLAGAAEEPVRARSLAAPSSGDEAAVSRLLSRADEQLAEPEASRRREAMAQLRAAVAVTEAARRLGAATPEPERREDPFRDDLRHVVRPRRPVPSAEALSGLGPDAASGMRPERRAERPRPAPLKLVASQRVDLPDAPRAFAEPVRPRRVGLEAPSGSRPGDSFAAFATEMGAVSLTDILEAAAAYTSFVEGAEDFSRPQIFDRVRQASPVDFSREDGLRSFGTLLRQGTITRVRGGRFQVTGESRFNPARRAG